MLSRRAWQPAFPPPRPCVPPPENQGANGSHGWWWPGGSTGASAALRLCFHPAPGTHFTMPPGPCHHVPCPRPPPSPSTPHKLLNFCKAPFAACVMERISALHVLGGSRPLRANITVPDPFLPQGFDHKALPVALSASGCACVCAQTPQPIVNVRCICGPIICTSVNVCVRSVGGLPCLRQPLSQEQTQIPCQKVYHHHHGYRSPLQVGSSSQELPGP